MKYLVILSLFFLFSCNSGLREFGEKYEELLKDKRIKEDKIKKECKELAKQSKNEDVFFVYQKCLKENNIKWDTLATVQ